MLALISLHLTEAFFCFLKLFFIFINVCVCAHMCTTMPMDAREGTGYPEIIGYCEPSVGAENQIQVLWKSSKYY